MKKYKVWSYWMKWAVSHCFHCLVNSIFVDCEIIVSIDLTSATQLQGDQIILYWNLQEMESQDYEHYRNLTLMFFFEKLLEKGGKFKFSFHGIVFSLHVKSYYLIIFQMQLSIEAFKDIFLCFILCRFVFLHIAKICENAKS